MTVSKAKTFRNILYTSLGKGLTLTCTAVTSLVVARRLSASDYGVVGFAGIIIGFLAQFSDIGVGSAVIRLPELNRRDLDTGFTLKVILSIAAFLLALLVAPFSHHFFDHPATADVVRLLALNFLISIIGFAPQTMLTREMNYRALTVPAVIGAVAQSILAVTLILAGWNYWAVVIANIGSVLVNGIILQSTKSVPIGLSIDWTIAREYLKFGLPLFGSGILIFMIMNLDNFLVGAYMGSAQLGYYALAFTWGGFICGLLYSTVSTVLFPAFSSIQNDAAAVRRWYLKTVELVAFIAVIANAALFANAHWFLVTFLGRGTEKWLPATLALQILCVHGIVRAITEALGPCLYACGWSMTILRATIVAGGLEIVLLLFALRSGRVELVAGAVLVAYTSQMLIYLPFLRREYSVRFGDILAKLWPVIPAFGFGLLITTLLPLSFGYTFLTLCARCLFTASIAAFTHGILSHFRCFQEVREMISQNFAQLAARS